MSERLWQQMVWANVASATVNGIFYEWTGRWWSLIAVTAAVLTVIWYCASWKGAS
ncbi:MAG TPA: hypothetical protein VK595_16975 [Vicinamibacterales bacterium]|nr:hypothetical protein [Vicinamibacterales bacterium]